MVEAGWNQTLVISVLERWLQQYWGCIPSRWGMSSRGIAIATPSSQWIQTATNYFKPQEENLLHENDTSHHIPMSRHTCSPVLSKLSFFITIGCSVYVVLYKWFDVMTCLDSTCYLFVNNLSIQNEYYSSQADFITSPWWRSSGFDSKQVGRIFFYYQSLHGVNSVFVLKEKSLTDLEVGLFQLWFVEAFMWPAGYHSRSVWF